MNFIEITKIDLDDYFFTLSNKGVIRQYRIKIFNSMSNSIRTEFQTKINDLVCTNHAEGIYEIVAEKASEELKKYLSSFKFRLIDQGIDDEEID